MQLAFLSLSKCSIFTSVSSVRRSLDYSSVQEFALPLSRDAPGGVTGHCVATEVQQNCRRFAAALNRTHFDGNVDHLLREAKANMRLRGVPENRLLTFEARMRASQLLFNATTSGAVSLSSWSLNQPTGLHQRTAEELS